MGSSKPKIDFLISNDAPLRQPTRTVAKLESKPKKSKIYKIGTV